MGVASFRFAVIAKNDLSGATERNYIDNLVTTDKQCAELALSFTDAICSADLNVEDLYEHFNSIIDKNREPVLAADAAPDGF